MGSHAGVDGLRANWVSGANLFDFQAKLLLGRNGNTGTVTVSLDRLDTTSVVKNGRARVRPWSRRPWKAAVKLQRPQGGTHPGGLAPAGNPEEC
ncbi:hypothetical protein [Streptomyces sp. NBC_00286]|uniref:hypothetical protein n=1 Tax=Streptomyces sp. NBC_00286 TaxID=2975701 RepID=UPI002E2C2AFD|nr:hypothetical protein [Streptomyces sp. NBC_00286]